MNRKQRGNPLQIIFNFKTPLSAKTLLKFEKKWEKFAQEIGAYYLFSTIKNAPVSV